MNACVISTFRCNARCHMCNIWKFPTRAGEEIDLDTISRLPNGLGRINLTGGEPMLRNDIEELVGIVYGKCRKVEISTNGYYTERLVKIAEKFPRVMIRISLEGLPALNDRLRGIPNGFDHALRSMLELKKTKVKDLGFSIVICDKNVGDLLSLYELSAGLGVEFAQSTMHNSWYFHKSDNAIERRELVLDELEKFIAVLLGSRRGSFRLRVKDWLRAYFNARIYNYIKYNRSCQGICSAGTDLFFVDPDANILPCNGSDRKWIMGNLKEHSFADIWNGPRAEAIRKIVSRCSKDCAFVGTARFDMLRHPHSTLGWILANKIRLHYKKPIIIESGSMGNFHRVTSSADNNEVLGENSIAQHHCVKSEEERFQSSGRIYSGTRS